MNVIMFFIFIVSILFIVREIWIFRGAYVRQEKYNINNYKLIMVWLFLSFIITYIFNY